MIEGIDVASYQDLQPAMRGKSFMIVKATENTDYINPKQAAQAAWARRNGAHVGFYHFLHSGNIAAQAAYFVAKNASWPGDSLWIDWEPDPQTGRTPTCAEKDQALREVKQLRPEHRVGLYCDRERWLHVDTTSYRGDGLWIADPDAPPGAPRIRAPWLLHQYGSPGGVDVDVAQFGHVHDMLTWAQSGVVPPAPHPTRPPYPPRPHPPAPAPAYTVHKDDTLTSIAAAHGTTVAALVRLNHIKNPDHIEPGEVLRLR